MPSAEENLTLLWMIMQQKLDSGVLTGIDWTPIATKLGLEKPTAASLRWSRLKKELTENDGVMKPTGEGTPKKAKKAAAPKAKKIVENGEDGDEEKPLKKRAPKKRKIEKVEDVKEETEQGDDDIKSEEESAGAEEQEEA